MNLLPILAISKIYMIPFFIMVAIMLCSPAIQINLSTKKNKYLGLIFPAIVFIFFLTIVLIIKPHIVLSIILLILPAGALVLFHIIVRNNTRF